MVAKRVSTCQPLYTQILKCSIYSGGQLQRAANNQENKGSVGTPATPKLYIAEALIRAQICMKPEKCGALTKRPPEMSNESFVHWTFGPVTF